MIKALIDYYRINRSHVFQLYLSFWLTATLIAFDKTNFAVALLVPQASKALV